MNLWSFAAKNKKKRERKKEGEKKVLTSKFQSVHGKNVFENLKSTRVHLEGTSSSMQFH